MSSKLNNEKSKVEQMENRFGSEGRKFYVRMEAARIAARYVEDSEREMIARAKALAEFIMPGSTAIPEPVTAAPKAGRKGSIINLTPEERDRRRKHMLEVVIPRRHGAKTS